MALEDRWLGLLEGKIMPKVDEKPYATLREAGSKAFFELKKYPFCKVEETETEKKAYLFKDYVFTLDSKKKVMWGEFKERPMLGESFTLCTHQKEWKTLFSFPSRKIREFLNKSKEDIKGKENGKHIRIITSQAYKLNAKDMVQIFGGKLWKMYDRDIACMAMKAFGFCANSFDYSLIWNNKEEVLDTHQKAPGLLVIWRDIFIEIMRGKMSCLPLIREIPEIDRIIPKINVGDSYIFKYSNLETWDFPNIIKVVKSFLERFELTTAGWKFLLKLSPMQVRKLHFNYTNNWAGFVGFLNDYSKIGLVPRFTLWKKLMQSVNRIEDSYFAIVRAATLHSQKSKKIRDFVDQFSDVMDWYRRGGPNRQTVVLDQNQMKADWNYFVRREQEWQREIAARNLEEERLRNTNRIWTSVINEMDVDGFKIVPITSTHGLIEEGAIMKHCVGNGYYASECVKNNCRVFSIQKEENRLATLELGCGYHNNLGFLPGGEKLTEKPTFWTINQCRGRHNGKVAEEVTKVAKKVLIEYNKEYNKQQKLLEKANESLQTAAAEGHALTSEAG